MEAIYCKGCVLPYGDGYRVKGDETEVTRMLVACMLTLERKGYDIQRIAEAVKNMKPKSSVRHGRWIDDRMEVVCSACKTHFRDAIDFIQGADGGRPKYCPNCGAKMDLEG